MFLPSGKRTNGSVDAMIKCLVIFSAGDHVLEMMAIFYLKWSRMAS